MINLKKATTSFITIFSIFLLFLMLQLFFVHYIDFKFWKIFVASSIAIYLTSLLYNPKIQFYKHFIIVFIFFISILKIKLIVNENICYDEAKFILAFYTGITSIYLILVSFLSKKKFFNLLFQIIMLLPTIIVWVYFFIAQAFLGVDTILAIFQTNISETKAYINDFIGLWQYIGLIIIFAIALFISKYNFNIKIKKLNKKILFILILTLITNIFLIYRYKNNILTDIIFGAKDYLAEYKEFKKQISERNIVDIKIDNIDTINKGIYVLVLGESQNKDHMSVYGYSQKTTPYLESMEKDKNFIKFTNTYSCHTHTIPVLSYALTSKNQYNDINMKNAISILDVAKACNIETVWLSNQVRYGGYDTPVSVIADTANQQVWINNNHGKTTNTNYYDIKLIDKLRKIKIKDNMLIVIHLMGNHGSYKDRYPDKFSKFQTNTNRINEYDNSILYNDYVVENILKKLKTLPNFKALIYCADHADAVDQDLAHDSTQFVPSMTHVPMYIYMTDSYIKNNIDVYSNLYKNKDCYFTNDLLFNLILGILNIKLHNFYEQQNDITNKYYDNNIKRFKTLYGKKRLQDIILEENLYLIKNNSILTSYTNRRTIPIPKNTILLHRVNNRKRLLEYFKKYAGFEIDVNFNNEKKFFNVSHDNIDHNEDLSIMLNDINDLKYKYLWIDFKNLSNENKEIALNVLNEIIKKNNLFKNHIIIESRNANALKIFGNSGYYTSLYLSCYTWDTKNCIKNIIKDIKDLENSNVDFVSSDARYFDIVKLCFPKVAHLFWVMDKANEQKITKHIVEQDNNTYIILNQDTKKYYQ